MERGNASGCAGQPRHSYTAKLFGRRPRCCPARCGPRHYVLAPERRESLNCAMYPRPTPCGRAALGATPEPYPCQNVDLQKLRRGKRWRLSGESGSVRTPAPASRWGPNARCWRRGLFPALTPAAASLAVMTVPPPSGKHFNGRRNGCSRPVFIRSARAARKQPPTEPMEMGHNIGQPATAAKRRRNAGGGRPEPR